MIDEFLPMVIYLPHLYIMFLLIPYIFILL